LFYVCLTAKSLRAATRPFGGNFKPRVSDGARLQRFRKTVTATTHRLFSVPVFSVAIFTVGTSRRENHAPFAVEPCLDARRLLL
jgi:hypothetical protein